MRWITVSPAKALAAATAVWLCIALGGASAAERGDSRVLLLPLGGVVVAAAVWRPFRGAGVATGAAAAIVYLGLRVYADGGAGIALPASLATVGFTVAGLLGETLARQLERDARRQLQDGLLIEELTPTTGASGVLKRTHAHKMLDDEVERARRYAHPVCVALVTLDDWTDLVERSGDQAAQDLLHETARLTVEQVRTSDAVGLASEQSILVVMPHTPLQGGQLFVEKLRLSVRRQMGRDIRAGLAEYPADAENASELLQEAAAALDFAQMSGLSVASRSLLTSGTA